VKRMASLLLMATSFTGCVSIDDARLESRLRRMARAAYTLSPGACMGIEHGVDYSRGFEDGYYDVASGGDGCTPALPPAKYWRATYASPLGQEHVDAWFEGFRDGAAAAKAEGAVGVGTIRIAREHREVHHRTEAVKPAVPLDSPTEPPEPPPPEAQSAEPPSSLPDAPIQPMPENEPDLPPPPIRRGRVPPPAPKPPPSAVPNGNGQPEPKSVPRGPAFSAASQKSGRPAFVPTTNGTRVGATSHRTSESLRLNLPKHNFE
jgi:hypothetical protein